MEGHLIGWKILPSLDSVCLQNSSVSCLLKQYIEKKLWSPADRQSLLECLGKLLLQHDTTQIIVNNFSLLLLDIVSRVRLNIEKSDLNTKTHREFCIALSQCLNRLDIQRFTLDYLKGKPCFTSSTAFNEPVSKKAKKKKYDGEDMCQAAWMFVLHLGDEISSLISMEDITPYLSHTNINVRWFACQTVIEYYKMTTQERETFLKKHFKDGCTDLIIRHSMAPKQHQRSFEFCKVEGATDQTTTNQTILETDLCDTVVCVNGVLLTRCPQSTDIICLDLLSVPSNELNLHNLAVAVSSGSPVLLQGVVGSGKTSLVEHLARLTGRSGAPQLTKIQLGDQMDSKALLGTYRCTEVPGEFVWQPGVLTQAVTKGYWVLLEDIDYAPMEVISVLFPLLESRTLSVPGHGDNVRAAPGFQLFATQRLVGGSSGFQKQQTGSSVLLDKLWTSILVEPMSRSELSQVLCKKYPKIETVIEKLLDIYFLLSAGDHQTALDYSMETNYENVGKFLSHDGRLISTRDLMTWCSRVNSDLSTDHTDTGKLVFQEAVDCFVSSLSKHTKRQPLAEAIGAKLNLTKIMVEYFLCKYKPDIAISQKMFTVGRVSLQQKEQQITMKLRKRSTFSYTRQSSILLEKVAVCVRNMEPVLLVGETGTGKTSSVQFLAEQLGHTLHVINMNQQSDSADLLGGFKPVDVRHIIKPFYEDFQLLFCETFSQKQNRKFLGHLQDCFTKRKWETLFALMEHTSKSAVQKYGGDVKLFSKWSRVTRRLSELKLQIKQTQNSLAFTFMEGSLVKAIRNGDWVLLDEINLAAMETLECLSGLLESTAGSVLLMERGDMEPIVRHPDFRLFACMNPATDVGKKDLSPGIRNRFTELFVDELDDPQDLKVLVHDYLQFLSLTSINIDGIVNFYLKIKKEALTKLTDSTGHRPHYSLRTLCRALKFVAGNPCGAIQRSIYEGFCFSFLTQLDRSSRPLVEQLVCKYCLGKGEIKSILKRGLPMPSSGKYLNFEGYWIPVGKLEPTTPTGYILTSSVRSNLKDLCRVVSAGKHPVLLQGETSVGKTSLIKWLAESSGNVCMRVNNHEHTDLQEYIGCYAADENGKLVFKDGVLVEAMKKGYWIILDELNLAPTDVLEALNRLLDDNRELYIPETQETVRANDRFMLFATQNPPGHYGGRKLLSRAFRNRFIELHYDEIPSGELGTILHERCAIPLSYAKRLVSVMLELQMRRCGSGVFAGKKGFMTLRDLFRWAERYKCPEMDDLKYYNWDKHLAEQGYMLLAGRVRKSEEADVIQEVIQKHFKCKINTDNLYTLNANTSPTTKSVLEGVLDKSADGFKHVFWTHSMRRLAVLIGQAVRYREPVLLVGETGCGKTTMCQLYAALYNTQLHSINCHLHTESADFLGGLRPVRSHSEEDKKDKLFEWMDGPLVEAMKTGAMFLIDEISLADDSVLERLNSVLEPEQTILLAEKGGGDGNLNEVEQVVAREGFHIFSTMNPGGDFGKKELSPALRNRFTEIWCPPSENRQDLVDIIEHNLSPGIHLCNQEDGTSGIGKAMINFVDWFTNNELGKRCTVSIRDILTWVKFINQCSTTVTDEPMDTDQTTHNKLDTAVAYIHGACLVFLDGLGAGVTSQGRDEVVTEIRTKCLIHLLDQVNTLTHQKLVMEDLYLLDCTKSMKNVVSCTETEFCIPPFSIVKGDKSTDSPLHYALEAPGTCLNAQRVLRALQLPRPLLLEGSPGVGKTSLVTAIAKASGRELVRINLSEQTDVTDLFGADLPVEGAEGGVFAWRDGPLLQALKAGNWIVLDELNLASQSVLEGLNACLDHRAEVYVPELGKTFQIQHQKTRIFACQNPLNQGGGRKGLPRSFLNRFTQVYIEPLCKEDLMFIGTTMYPKIPEKVLSYMVQFNMQMHLETVEQCLWGQRGGPWEFNLRDLFRWCDLILANQACSEPDILNPGEYVRLIYADRMRRLEDKQKVYELFSKVFPKGMEVYHTTGRFHCGTTLLQVGHSFLDINQSVISTGGEREEHLDIIHQCLEPLESIMKCIEMNWMAILVGTQGSSKSSLVKMLSTLTGNQLNTLAMNSAMDTTELLGGFEQADINRHIEETANSVQQIALAVCKHVVLNETMGGHETALKVQTLWKNYNNMQESQGENRSTIDEYTHMKEAVALLLKVVNECLKYRKGLATTTSEFSLSPSLSEIKDIKKTLKAIQHKLSSTEPGAGGGVFEWIDSLLVKSLKQGHWLLIDNVNFCNASVLDRLNALLEPNGVLHINERGVIDGQIPKIEPHPNFRLFLAMDPRHGEISRAMRNRGVEIYIPGEEDGKPYSEADLQHMMYSIGLQNRELFTWLLHFHNVLKTELPLSDRPTIHQLFQAARCIGVHCKLGYLLDRAAWSACHSVYVQTVRRKESKQKSQTLLTDHFTRLTEQIREMSGRDRELASIKLPDIVECYKHPVISTIKRTSALFVRLLNSESMDVSIDMLRLRFALAQTFHYTPTAYISQMIDWMKHCCRNKVHIESTDLSQYVLNDLWQIFQPVCDLVSKLSSREILENPDSDVWNPQLLERLTKPMNPAERHQLVTDCNRVHIMKTVQMNLAFMKKFYYAIQMGLEKDKTNGKQTLSEAISHLGALFPEMVDAITDSVPYLLISDYTSVVKVLDGIQWLKRLYEVTALTIHDESIQSQLGLFWKWWYKHSLPYCISDTSQNKALLAVVSVLQEMLSKDDLSYKLFVKVWRTWSHSRPFWFELEAKDFQSISHMTRPLCLWKDHSDLFDKGRVELMVERRQYLLDTFNFLSNHLGSDTDRDEIRKLQTELQSCLVQHGLLTRHDYHDVMETDSADSSHVDEMGQEKPTHIVKYVQLWPLFDYISTVQSWSFLEGICKGTIDACRMKQLCNFSQTCTPADVADLVLYKQCDELDLKNCSTALQCSILKRLRKSTAVYNANKWLSWGKEMDGSEDVDKKKVVQRSFHQSTLSSILYSLLSRADNSVSLSVHSNVKLDSPLRTYKQELQQLHNVSQHLWTHVPVYGSQNRGSRHIEVQNLYAALQQTLFSLSPLLRNCSMEEFNCLVTNCVLNDTNMAKLKLIISDNLQNNPEIVTTASRCIDKISEVKGTSSEFETNDNVAVSNGNDLYPNLNVIGECWIDIGALNIQLLAPKGSIDPVEKLAIKVKLMKEELLEVSTDLEVLCEHHSLLTGKDLTELPPHLVHPHVTHLVTRSRELTQRIELLDKQVAYRPIPSQYKQLVTDIHNFTSSLVSQSTILKLVKTLKTKMKKKSAFQSAIQEVESWEISLDKFIERLQIDYPVYRDVIEPFICALQQLIHGMNVLTTFARRMNEENMLKSLILKDFISGGVGQSIQNVVLAVGRFPTVSSQARSCVDLASILISDRFEAIINGVLTAYGDDGGHRTAEVIHSILSCSLFHLQNEAKLRGELPPNLLTTYNNLLETYVLSWQQQEEARRAKEEEESSLYRYKSQLHGDERSEEEQLEAELKETFPQFQQDFQDLIEPTNFEDNWSTPQTNQKTEQSSSLHISAVQMAQIHRVHGQLYSNLVSTNWYQSKSCDKLRTFDWIKPVLCSYTAASTLTQCLQTVLGSNIDTSLLGSHLVIAVIQRYYVLQGENQDIASLLPDKTVYDIYRDTNVPEVIQCLPILDNMVTRVNQLLEEWPDHHTLKQLIQIVDRIKSQPITAPLVKFLTGMELLLTKAQDWECNASQHVSLMNQLSEISHLIIQWRKLELSCWSNLLNIEVHKYQNKASRWWFHLYEVFQAALKSEEDSDDLTEFIKTIKQFMEEATLGDYETRLNMLLSYHLQLVTMETGSKVTQLVNVTWNLYQVYSMFSQSVQNQLETLRTPIEKELKGFVKIARWSDINYWALKQTVDKTHKTLHKHLKQFQTILRQPVQGVLQESTNQTTDTKPVWSEQLQSYSTALHTGIKAYKPMVTSLVETYTDIPFSLYSKNMNKYWGMVVTSTQYIDHMATLDQFIGELITEMQELQSLDVDRSLSKEKQKSEAKHINLRKRKSLSDLFKYLAKLGLSYRKGLTMENGCENQSILVPPTDLSVAFTSDVHIQAVWEGCLHYYYSSISRKAQFDKSVQAPSKELGISNLERCKGFVEHLYRLLVEQYTKVSSLSESFKRLSSAVEETGRLISEEKEKIQQNTIGMKNVFSQEDALRWKTDCKDLLVQLCEGLNQFLVLLLCCPDKQSGAGYHPSPILVTDLSNMALVKQGDERINIHINTVKEIIGELDKSRSELKPESGILLWSDMCSLKKIYGSISSLEDESILSKLQAICKDFSDPECLSHPNAFTDVLHFLTKQIKDKSRKFLDWFTNCETGQQVEVVEQLTLDGFSTNLKSCVHHILISVQKLKKSHVIDDETNEEKTKSLEDDLTAEEEEDIKENLLTKHIVEKLQADSEVLNIDNIVTEVNHLVEAMLKCSDNKMLTDMVNLFEPFLVLLKQYQNIVHHVLVSNIATERIIGKMLAVLLSVFTELATKGFCIPPELSEEMEGEGATEFCDIEQGGLGEGEGMKNVSDQIENEDQLDDAKRPEDRKEEELSDQPDVKSEENAIEMSDDFEGKVQDLEDADKQDDDDESDDNDNDDGEIDKQMGEVDGENEEKLDEQMWGHDEEEEESEKDQKEETGPGDGEQTESELVAKDDNQDAVDNEKDKDQNGEEEKKDQKPHNLEEMDQEYDEEQIDPYHEKHGEEQKAPDNLDLPDDLRLDDDQEGEEQGEEEPMDEEKDSDSKDDTTMPQEEKEDDSEPDDKQENTTENEEEKEETKEGEDMDTDEIDKQDTDQTERQEEDGKDDPGFSPEDEITDDKPENNDDNTPEEIPQGVENYGKTSHEAETVEQSDTAKDNAGESAENQDQEKTSHEAETVKQSDTTKDNAGESAEKEDKEQEGTGEAKSNLEEGHQGQKMTSKSSTSQGKRKQYERQPGKSDSDRSLGSDEQKYKKLKTVDSKNENQQPNDKNENREGDEYEHIKDSSDHHDAQTLDTASKEQQEQQGQINTEKEEKDSDVDGTEQMEDTKQEDMDEENPEVLKAAELKKSLTDKKGVGDEAEEDMAETDDTKYEIEGDKIDTLTVARGLDSTIHTALENFHLDNFSGDLESLRAELETQLGSWNQANLPETRESESVASELWHRYEALTSSLSQDLCEQLRLVLEPTQATKLKGDYRTGKRLNMRKVIPYIASQFRKDKIWLRRTKPSKREYQVMIAIDDSSSMVDNRSKQIAFESLALIANALSLLEAGQLSICSFGETVNVLHPFTEQFTSQSGAHLLQYLTFEQKKTKIAQLLKQATSIMMEARQHHHTNIGNPETAQLLLIVSDGRGLFMEGMEMVKTAVRQAREAKVFIVFVIIDSPNNKDSILDIRVPVFKEGGQIPEIKSYMDSFPFPFYIILRDINSLPTVLSDALRQWFELVSAVDR